MATANRAYAAVNRVSAGYSWGHIRLSWGAGLMPDGIHGDVIFVFDAPAALEVIDLFARRRMPGWALADWLEENETDRAGAAGPGEAVFGHLLATLRG